MSETMTKLRKQRGTRVDIEGDDVHLRNMMVGELRRVDDVPPDLKPGFIVGCKLCDDAGAGPEFPQQEGESDQDWSKRVMTEIANVSTAKIAAIMAWTPKTPKPADIVKN